MQRIGIALASGLLLATTVAALDVPRLESRVTDLAGLLTPEEVANLENRLRELENSDSTQIAVLVIPGLEGEVLEDYSERVATAWRVGQRGRDNGAVLLVAMKERKLRIEVGYGLESTLTDARSRRIIENEVLPYFRQGQYYEGISAGVSAMIGTVRGVYEPVARPRQRRTSAARKPFDWIILLLIPGLWLLNALGKWGGGIVGAGAGAYLAYSLAGALLFPLAIGAVFGGLAGLVIGGVIRSGMGGGPRGRFGGGGGPFIFPGGGFSSGGGFSVGGFSGGGGGFGGGGSSGSW